jgi:hypothetical protein
MEKVIQLEDNGEGLKGSIMAVKLFQKLEEQRKKEKKERKKKKTK